VSTEVPAFRAAVVKRIDKQDDGCVPNALPASASLIRRRAVDLLDTCRDVGRPVVIVSNNAEPAIEAFLVTTTSDTWSTPSSAASPAGPS